MTLYFDTSALVKLVVVEDGSELVAELWSTRYPAAASVLCYPEGRAALSAARRARRLSQSGYARALADFEELQHELLAVGVDRPLASHAGRLADEFGLRGYDAVHLASAVSFGEVTVVTWDRDLASAALASGCAIAPAP